MSPWKYVSWVPKFRTIWRRAPWSSGLLSMFSLAISSCLADIDSLWVIRCSWLELKLILMNNMHKKKKSDKKPSCLGCCCCTSCCTQLQSFFWQVTQFLVSTGFWSFLAAYIHQTFLECKSKRGATAPPAKMFITDTLWTGRATVKEVHGQTCSLEETFHISWTFLQGLDNGSLLTRSNYRRSTFLYFFFLANKVKCERQIFTHSLLDWGNDHERWIFVLSKMKILSSYFPWSK